MGAEGGSSDRKVGGGGGEDGVVVHVRCSNGSKFDLRTALDSTIGSFKAVVAQNCDVPADQQRLIYKGRILKDDHTLESYGLQADHTVHMVRGFTPNASTPAAALHTGSPNGPLGVTRVVGSNQSGGFGGAAPGLFGAGLPVFEQELAQNPNMMSEIMNTPAIQSLMNNPDIMRGLIMSNPQMRDIIDRNPELAHILNDPGILRQTLEASRNPELMREMMRNTDRAMSNIESSPEGFNMLRRVYENVQEPFLNATTLGGNTGNDVSSNPFGALSENQARSQARDGPNNPLTSSVSASGPAAPNTNPLPNPWNGTSGGTQTNATTRSTPYGEARAPGVGGQGGNMLNGMPDTAQMNQMMQSLLSDPQYMNQILNLSPQLRSMVDTNPQLREMMQNPELLRQLTSPETMQQMLTLQQSLQSQLNRSQSARETAQSVNLDLLMNMFDGLEAGGMSGPNTSNVPPEEFYVTQLSQLQEMGFFDTQENIRALRATSGNVHAAVERLLGNPGT